MHRRGTCYRNRMGRMAIIDELLGILFLSNIPGNQCCKLDPFVFGIQLAERKIIVIQRHLMVLRIHGTALQMHGFLPFSQVYRVFIIPYNVWKCCIFNGFWVPEWTLFRTNLVCLPGSVLPPSCFRHSSRIPSDQQAEPLSHPASFLVLFCL